MSIEKGNKKTIWAWTMFDWANSVYSLVITSSVFQAYYSKITVDQEEVDFFGWELNKGSLYAYSISVSFLIVAFISPLLSSIADYTGSKKGFMKFFTYLGAIACMAMFFFDANSIEFGIILAVLASIGYSGGIVFYNAYLPEIAQPEDHDKISAKGFAKGYIGSMILLSLNLAMIIKPDWFGIDTSTEFGSNLPYLISFVLVGLWWIGFSQITFKHIPSNVYGKKPSKQIIKKGYNELQGVWRQLSEYPRLKRFLFAFFFYTMGTQTVMYMATSFGKDELKLDDMVLIPTIMLIQLVGVFGAHIFAWLSSAFGNIKALSINVALWILICGGAFFIYGAVEFMIVGGCVGLVMGGIQALSRSTYSKMLPETHDHASFFSFYDVTEKLGIVLGTWCFGAILALTGTMRNSVLVLALFFIIGFILLRFVNFRMPEINVDEK